MASQQSAVAAMVRVRLFAALRERAGWSERSLPLAADGCPLTPADLWRQLALGEAPPGQAAEFPATIRVAINHAFAPADTPLNPGDEVAFLPPITGG
ncbi:MoaD/ThiS family protein [Synechococcus sp. CCY 9618]|uniref:MoaD/ThiS family protein n=1 Tax=Synechococcus sp. CCY 9618 TaxID=2815602 RepID=UPI0020B3D035|nr:MoaD/ThiS family protein [Synechococcus sp. CCY 9618]